MAVLKVIEILANSEKSWEDATNNAVEHASQSAQVKDGKVSEYRVNVKITFEVK